ncbi:MAG: ester cyclase [Pseudonocardia sp.]
MADHKAIIRRFIDEYQTGGDKVVLRDTVSPRMVNRTPLHPDPQGGVEEVEQIFDMFHAAFADFAVEIRDQLAEGDKVMTYKVFSGTHTGEFMGIAPTGRAVRFDVMDIVRLDGGQIVEHWGMVDQLALLRQLGVLS